jgi:beta-phosphoglucomutase-like phosphatase (HAD superfamily)
MRWDDQSVHNRESELEELVGEWRAAFVAAEETLRAAARDHDLSDAEIGRRARGLGDERAATVKLLESLASTRDSRPLLARLVGTTREAKQLLALPPAIEACVFNVDGVLVASAALHADAWKVVFDSFLSGWSERTGADYVPFSRRIDYPELVHGRSREEAVRTVLASRGISLPLGTTDDRSDAETVRGLARRKVETLLARLARGDVYPFAGAHLYLQLAHDGGLPCAVVSGSAHVRDLLAGAELDDVVDVIVDGAVAERERLLRKPAPDMLLAASRGLGEDPAHTAVFETTPDGIRAARAGGFAFVVGVVHETDVVAMRRSRPDVLTPSLGELIERQLA